MSSVTVTVQRPNGDIETVIIEVMDSRYGAMAAIARGDKAVLARANKAMEAAGRGRVIEATLNREPYPRGEAEAEVRYAKGEVEDARRAAMQGQPDGGFGRIKRAEERLAAAREAYVRQYGPLPGNTPQEGAPEKEID